MPGRSQMKTRLMMFAVVACVAASGCAHVDSGGELSSTGTSAVATPTTTTTSEPVVAVSAIQRELETPGPGREPIEFVVDAPEAETVMLEMTANQWNSNPGDTIQLSRVDHELGTHAITLYLGEDEWLYRFRVDGVWTVDELNPLRVGAEDGQENSLLVVGETVPGVTEQPDTEKGDIEEVVLDSEILGQEHSFLVYTPPGYTSAQSYPLLVMLHGYGAPPSIWVEAVGLQHAMDNLLADGEIARFVVVMPSAETSDYMWDSYGEHILDEVLPYMDSHYAIDQKKESTAIGGFSMGGHGAVQLAYLRQDRFGLAMPIMMAAPFCPDLVCTTSSDFETHYPDGFDTAFSMWVGANDELGFVTNHVVFAEFLDSLGLEYDHVVSTSSGHFQDGHSVRCVRVLISDVLTAASDYFTSQD